MESEWNFAVMVALTCLTIFSIAFSRLEKYIFGDCDLHIGAPDFWVFKLGYHIPMAVLFLSLAVGYDLLILNHFERWFGVVYFLPSALIVEDVFYYVKNPYCKPDKTEEITSCLGFVGKVPVLWIVGFLYTCLIAYWRFA